MIAHGKDIKIFSGNSNPELAQGHLRQAGSASGQQPRSRPSPTVRAPSPSTRPSAARDVFVVQSTCMPVNDNLMELLIMIDALKRASAGRITAVIPYFGYARQDRKAKPRDPISAKLVANLITARRRRPGADHGPARHPDPGLLRHPRGQPAGQPHLCGLLPREVRRRPRGRPSWSPPTWARVARARAFAQKLGMPLAIVDKRRQKANSSEVMNIIGDVRDKHVILLDDMVDTGGSLCGAAKALVELGGATRRRRLRLPRRALRPRHRAHRGQRHQGGALPRTPSPPSEEREVRQDQVHLRGPHVRRGHRAASTRRPPSPRCSVKAIFSGHSDRPFVCTNSFLPPGKPLERCRIHLQ